MLLWTAGFMMRPTALAGVISLAHIASSSSCTDAASRLNPCSAWPSELHCVLAGLSRDDVSFLRHLYRDQDASQKGWRTVLPPPMAESCSSSSSEAIGGAFLDESNEDEGEQQTGVLRRMLPRSATPTLELLAQKIERMAEHAASSWGFRLRLGGDDEWLQFMRYIPGGFAPLHRDAFGSPAWEVDADEALTWEPEHPDGGINFTQVSRRLLSVIVQLNDHEVEYSGQGLRFYLGTADEPELAQRGWEADQPNGDGNQIINAVRANATTVLAPRCAGDVIFFPGLIPHDVLPIESGSRESLVWWIHGEPPAAVAEGSGKGHSVWSGMSPWLDPRTGKSWVVSGRDLIRGD